MDLDGNLADPTNGLQRGSANELRRERYVVDIHILTTVENNVHP